MPESPKWQPSRGMRTDRELAALMETAAAALEEEDQRLAKGIDQARAYCPDAFDGVGAGLSYWVYETTLVYIIWRAWMLAGKPAALDWTVASLRYHQPGPGSHGKKRVDLLLLGTDMRPYLAFEAKWWNVDGKGARKGLHDDATKLMQIPALRGARKYLLVFWHEARGTAKEYRSEVQRFCDQEGLRLAGSARFDARFRDKTGPVSGLFVMAALEVAQSAQAG